MSRQDKDVLLIRFTVICSPVDNGRTENGSSLESYSMLRYFLVENHTLFQKSVSQLVKSSRRTMF